MPIKVKLRNIKNAVLDLICPPAAKDIALNTKNRDATIEKYNYGPLNVDEPADYWQKIAKYWKTSEEAAKKSLCGNCVAFDISPRMKDCLPGDTFDDDGELGYCWMHHFKCHSARSCHTWAKGGPIAKDSESAEWQEKNKNSISEKLNPSMGAGAYVKDFYDSDAPQFKGKSKKKKREMAVAAYLDDKEELKKEEVDQLDEKCQKGYKTHPTRKTKKMFGKTYRNCVKAEGVDEDEQPLEEQELDEKKKRKTSHQPTHKRSKKYFGSSFYDFGLLHGDSAGSGAVGDSGVGDGNRKKKDRKGASASYCESTPCDKMGFTQKASCKSQGIKDCYRGNKKNEGKDPKVGTGKKPKGSGRRLYTDENPEDTVSVEFSSVSAIQKTLAKPSFKSKSHKRQSQIINLIHQRARAAYKNAKDPKVKARLKKAYDYAKKRKEASKEKTKRMQKEKKK